MSKPRKYGPGKTVVTLGDVLTSERLMWSIGRPVHPTVIRNQNFATVMYRINSRLLVFAEITDEYREWLNREVEECKELRSAFAWLCREIREHCHAVCSAEKRLIVTGEPETSCVLCMFGSSVNQAGSWEDNAGRGQPCHSIRRDIRIFVYPFSETHLMELSP